MPENSYSPAWFSIFMDTIPAEQTRREVDFVEHFLTERATILDIPCGTGRHARLLAERGYQVIGVDNDRSLLALRPAPHLSWIRADMRWVPVRDGAADAVICLWQSFGHHSEDENRELLRRWRGLVRDGGILILDLFDRDHFVRTQGVREFERAGVRIRERRRMVGDRLLVDLYYGDREVGDHFEWQLHTGDGIRALGRSVGWDSVRACSGYDPARPPDPDRPRVQYVFAAD